jgi:hypothetical protein
MSRKEKEKLVIQLAHEGKTTRDTAKQVHISLRDIGIIIRKEADVIKEEGFDDDIAKEKQKIDNEQQKVKEKQERIKYLSP